MMPLERLFGRQILKGLGVNAVENDLQIDFEVKDNYGRLILNTQDTLFILSNSRWLVIYTSQERLDSKTPKVKGHHQAISSRIKFIRNNSSTSVGEGANSKE